MSRSKRNHQKPGKARLSTTGDPSLGKVRIDSTDKAAATAHLCLGVALGWLPSGLPMIGIQPGYWLGALILLACFGLIANAIRIFGRGWRSWRRYSTTVAVFLVPALAIGFQVYDKYKIRKPSGAPVASEKAQFDLTVMAVLESNARRTDGDFWVARDASPKTLRPANRAIFLRVVNLQNYPIRIDRFNAYAQAPTGQWEEMRLVSLLGVQDVYATHKLKNATHVDWSDLSFERNTEAIPANEPAEGWVLFDRPANPTSIQSPLRIFATDDHGNTVSAKWAPTSTEGGLRGAPIPIIDFHDLSEYRIQPIPGQ